MSDKESKIEWLGIDGFLVILFPIVVSIMWFSFDRKIDFIIGKLVPYGTAIVVILIICKYFREVIGFSKVNKKD
ncbi:hypothetical protein [Terrisporobacter sp.]|uniref:hypothetical protein n=1 Tax=Terrisporobacter sp. TaxID=1965305 RepID=UPI00260E640F|nr:hypothetical protein [Terrisporobacter sp.]